MFAQQKDLRNRELDVSGRVAPDAAGRPGSRRALRASKSEPVTVRVTHECLPTYMPAAPDRNPMFLEKRVYQGSSGRVYPLPFTDRIHEQPIRRHWRAIWIENEYLRVLVLPEIGGRIHRIQDKTNGYDLVYYQPVIKPALVGLAGPWISGGIEFNWPQHHRPATFLPVDFEVEEHADGSRTIWCSDHDPMTRLKGMHGVCLHPGKAFVELKVRAYNRTPFVQTFLWWANVATRVHEAYQSFFPPDVYYIADHARRAMSEYPLAQGIYYGVNYGERAHLGVPANEVPRQFVPPHCRWKSQISNFKFQIPNYAPNDLSFYANIPVPTSYMCMGSKEDFFGGYDYRAQAGIVHIANHHISPGKKQWTWGNHEFGYAWDRNLTDPDELGVCRPYIEIMAGVYTDNQPDFSFLQPGETKTWSQYWYPIQKIGPAQRANLDAAVSLCVLEVGRASPLSKVSWQIARSKTSRTRARFGVCVTRAFPGASLRVSARNKSLFSGRLDLAPDAPFVKEIGLPTGIAETDVCLRLTAADGSEIITCRPEPRIQSEVPPPATEPPAPDAMASADELFITGLHLDQYRHATRCPTLYWREALRRDPLDSRCNNALGLWHLRRGEFAEAERHFRKALERLTRRNPNPFDGEPSYNLGLCLRFVGRDEEAYEAFYKATWNQAWAGAAYHALAEIDCARRNWFEALEHLNRSLRFDTDNLRARNLKVVVLRKLANEGKAAGERRSSSRAGAAAASEWERQAWALLRETLALDPLDWWARRLRGGRLTCDLQVRLDVAHDHARAGFYEEAVEWLTAAEAGASTDFDRQPVAIGRNGEVSGLPDQNWGALPLVHYTLGWLFAKQAARSARGPAQSRPQPQFVRQMKRHFKIAADLAPDCCFPFRLEEIAILETAMRANPRDARAPYYLGNLFYDRRRHEEAIQLWEKAARLDENFAVVWRNLGIGYFNVRKQPAKARAAYDRALRADPKDARLLYERDQLWKRLGETPSRRLRELEKHPGLVRRRDDLSIELCALYNQTGRPSKALELLRSRRFQPWEGGEGGPLGQHVRAHLALGTRAMAQRDYACACAHFEAAMRAPENLGEARHLLANQSDVHYWLGCALAATGQRQRAREHWQAAATFKGDFQEMSVRTFSEMTYYSARSWEKLGGKLRAGRLFRELLACARQLRGSQASIDYFATSLPTMLLFEDDLQFRQETTAWLLEAQARLGLGQKARAKKILEQVLRRDPNHPLAADLISAIP